MQAFESFYSGDLNQFRTKKSIPLKKQQQQQQQQQQQIIATKHCFCWYSNLHTGNALFAGGGGLFISSPFEAGLNRDQGLISEGEAYLIQKRRWYQFSIKNQNTQCTNWKSKVQEGWRSCSQGSESNPNFQLVCKPYQISLHKYFQS